MGTISGPWLRFVRAHAHSVLVLGSVAWVAVSLVLAVQHGAQRRATFDGPGEKRCQEACKVHAPIAAVP